jgi:hypothetical protein
MKKCTSALAIALQALACIGILQKKVFSDYEPVSGKPKSISERVAKVRQLLSENVKAATQGNNGIKLVQWVNWVNWNNWPNWGNWNDWLNWGKY